MLPSEGLELGVFRFAESTGKASWRPTNLGTLTNSLEFVEDTVLVDALLLKLLASLPFLQGGGFVGVSWRRVLVASLLGNAVSFFIGVLAGGAPWVVHETGAMK